jgi:type I restriction enzyme, R subunit
VLQALKTFNPDLPDSAYLQALYEITEKSADKTLGQINKDKHDLLTKGILVSFKDTLGQAQSKRLKLFDFDNPLNNVFLAVRQFELVGELYNRRPDVVGFVNGIPLVFFELKAHHQDLAHAYHQNIKDYKDTIPHVFHCNAIIILSNGTDARVGTITSPYQYFLEWKRIEEESEGVVSLDTMLRGTCDKARLLDLFENFLLFDGQDATPTKLMAKNHQFIGVNKVIASARNIGIRRDQASPIPWCFCARKSCASLAVAIPS